jgi:hypothetical protein
MTCKGYDSKAVKIGKPVKTLAATIMDKHVRGAFIRSYVKIAEADANQRTNRNNRSKGDRK